LIVAQGGTLGNFPEAYGDNRDKIRRLEDTTNPPASRLVLKFYLPNRLP